MGSTDAASSVIQQVRAAMLMSKATVGDLDAVGSNFGVPRPTLASGDSIYRSLLAVLMWQPKAVLSSIYNLLGAVFGTQESIRSLGGRPWRVYEVNPNEIVVELPVALIAGTNEISSYLHGATGFGFVPGAGPFNQFTTNFDISVASAVNVTGIGLWFNTAPGTWTQYGITNYVFSGGVGTVTVNAATLPAGGGQFYLDVPGDLVASYRGHYLATGGFQGSYSTAAGPLTNTLSVVGDATQDVAVGMTVLITNNQVFQTRVVQSLSYSNATNVTTVVVTTTDVTGGQTGQPFILAQELADTSTTTQHNDRLYLTGTGLYQVVQQYLTLLNRAAGITVRQETI